VLEVVQPPVHVDAGDVSRSAPPRTDAIGVRWVLPDREHPWTVRLSRRAQAFDRSDRVRIEHHLSPLASLGRSVDEYRRLPLLTWIRSISSGLSTAMSSHPSGVTEPGGRMPVAISAKTTAPTKSWYRNPRPARAPARLFVMTGG
jgi:hypothetical protein